MNVVAKYLASYAEPEARALLSALAASRAARFERALVVPVCGETPECIDGIQAALEATPGCLSILVLNAETSAPAATHESNAQLAHWLEQRFASQEAPWLERQGVSLNGALFHHWETPGDRAALAAYVHGTGSLLLLERSGQQGGLPPKTGVGLARKLGTDLALAFWHAGMLASPWIFHCDADSSLPASHLKQALPAKGAISFAFRHVASSESEVDLATFEYEARLRYHVLGLRHAGSPCAFHALGSSLAVHAESYAAVRGFPKRNAGEDFYLLDKVNKIHGVTSLYDKPVQIMARRSVRVPFGTGAAVEKQLRGEALRVDHPDCFAHLRELLESVSGVIASHDLQPFEAYLARAPRFVATALTELGYAAALQTALEHTKTRDDLWRRVYAWFDGLKTLRLVHSLRSELAPIPLETALELAAFLPKTPRNLGGVRLAWLLEVCDTLAEEERSGALRLPH